MSDGGKASGRESSNLNSNRKKTTSSDEFGREISKIAVAQICESTGFNSTQRSAIDTLADIAGRFIVELGKSSMFYANLSGRSSCNEFDIIQGIEDLSSSHGFASASDAQHCLVGSGVVRGIIHFVNSREEIPFARQIPNFPVARQSLYQPRSFAQIGEEPPKRYILNWLPAFPEPHTCLRTPDGNERATDARLDKSEEARQQMKAESSLVSLQERLVCNDSSGFADNDRMGKLVVASNPFLAPPLPASEKGSREIVIPNEASDQKKVTVQEIFEPPIEAAKPGSVDCETEEKRALPKRRPPVHFKLGIGKKSLPLPSLSSEVTAVKGESWFFGDDEKDEKNQRAEMILKKAMETPHELAQL